MKKNLLIITVILLLNAKMFSQNVGIGTAPNSPIAKLEVKGDGSNSQTNAFILRNSTGDTLFRVRNDGRIGVGYNGSNYGRTMNLAGNGLNFYKTDAIFSGAIFPTDTSIVMWSQIEDNNYVILQPSWGKVGIGTYSPKAKLDVNGSVILGDNGTELQRVIKVTVNKDLPAIATLSAAIVNFTVAGANTGSTVYISPAIALADGLLISYVRVSAADTVEVKFMNVSAGTINHGLIAFYITVIE